MIAEPPIPNPITPAAAADAPPAPAPKAEGSSPPCLRASVPPCLLPPLSPTDSTLLLRLFTLAENYPALAAELAEGAFNHLREPQPAPADPSSPPSSVPSCLCASVPSNLLDLYAWSSRPDIAAWIAFHRSATDNQRRAVALNALESVVKTTDSPIERRRAATTILRALDGRLARLGSSPRSPGGRSGAPEPPSEPEPPSPSVTPNLTNSPRSLAAVLAADLREESMDQALATIQAILAPRAPIADAETLEGRLETLPLLSDQVVISTHRNWACHHSFADGHELTITDSPTGAKLTLRFVRLCDKPWLLFDLNTG